MSDRFNILQPDLRNQWRRDTSMPSTYDFDDEDSEKIRMGDWVTVGANGIVAYTGAADAIRRGKANWMQYPVYTPSGMIDAWASQKLTLVRGLFLFETTNYVVTGANYAPGDELGVANNGLNSYGGKLAEVTNAADIVVARVLEVNTDPAHLVCEAVIPYIRGA